MGLGSNCLLVRILVWSLDTISSCLISQWFTLHRTLICKMFVQIGISVTDCWKIRSVLIIYRYAMLPTLLVELLRSLRSYLVNLLL
jgi:hypothetical protein